MSSLKLTERETVESLLLPEDDPWLVHEFQRRAQMAADATSEKKDTKWQEHFLAQMEKHHLSWSNVVAPGGHKNSDWFGLLSEAQQMCIGFYLATDPTATSIDCGQSVGRAFVSNDDFLKTIIPASVIYLVKQRRPLLGMECLKVHGMPDRCFDMQRLQQENISDSLLKDLAGNSKVAGCIAAVLLAMLAHWPTATAKCTVNASARAQAEHDSDHDYVADMLDLFLWKRSMPCEVRMFPRAAPRVGDGEGMEVEWTERSWLMKR